MVGRSFNYHCSLRVQDSVPEREPDALGFDNPKFHRQYIVVPSWPFVVQVTFNDWKYRVLLLRGG